MRRVNLVSSVVLWTIFLVAGCGGGGDSQANKEHHAHESHSEGRGEKLAMSPEGDSGVKGTATFEDANETTVVKLELRGLPKPDTPYLAHIHPGTCAQGEEEEESHGGHHEQGEHHEGAEEGEAREHSHEHGEEIEYPLSQVRSNGQGEGSSTTTLHDTSVEGLFSGGPKHVNVHEAGAGDPPVLTCADLKRAG